MTAIAHPAGALRARTGRLGRVAAGPATVTTDRSSAVPVRAGTVRSWPLLVLAAPAAAEVWSGWVGIAQKTGSGLVSPLPGIWPALHLDTTITLPVGVEAYAEYALRAWLAREDGLSSRTRRFARWSAIGSFALGMAGQVAYHLLAQAGAARAPWPVTTLMSCLPVLVLAMGDRAGPHAARRRSHRSGPARPRRDRQTSHALVRRGPGRTSPGPERRPAHIRVRSPSQDQNGPQGGGPRHRRRDRDTGSAGDRPGTPDRGSCSAGLVSSRFSRNVASDATPRPSQPG